MTTVKIKSNLHKIIDSIEDHSILNAVYSILSKVKTKKSEIDFWDELSEEEKASIEEGLSQIKKGQIYSHEEVMKEIAAKFNI